MKLCVVSLLVIVSFVTRAGEPVAITNVWLNDQVVTEILIGLNRVTTVSFPRPIQSVDGAGLTADGRTPGVVQIGHQAGDSALAFRALAPGASANVNVRIGDRTYVLLLKESPSPLFSVNFHGGTTAVEARAGRFEVAEAGDLSPALSASQLIGLVDRARAFEVLRKHHPEWVANVTLSRPGSTNDYSTFTVVLAEVFRFDRADALVFHVILQNKSASDVRYRPGSWAVRIGDHLYSQALSDCSGVIPARGASRAWFVIQGDSAEGRNGLSPNNRFIILVNPS